MRTGSWARHLVTRADTPERSRAWQFLHCVMVWKTASRTSDRLYTRSEILDFVVKDFETFSNAHKTTTPGFDNPPTNLLVNGVVNQDYAIYAASQRFGPWPMGPGDAVVQPDFQIGYWLTALAIGERLGFNAALRAASTKAGAVLDWMITQHRKRVVGRINSAPRANLGADNSFTFYLWRTSHILAAGGNAGALAQKLRRDCRAERECPDLGCFPVRRDDLHQRRAGYGSIDSRPIGAEVATWAKRQRP